MKIVKTVVITILVLIAAGLIYVFSGVYDIGQDVPHTTAVRWLLQVARERSIEVHDSGIKIPDLGGNQQVAAGAQVYAHHCSGCHLAPGKEDTPIRQALYPRPPHLAKASHIDPVEAFWAIKHGIKFTAMPAWGTALDDSRIWSVVAFLEKQPTLSAVEYQALLSEPAPATPAAPAVKPAGASSAPQPPKAD